MNQLFKIYYPEMPSWLQEFSSVPSMIRLQDVGMNCGCEYTSFPLFKNLRSYSRYDHSVGVALIVYHFTHDKKQTLAALFHDISTPVFAHTIDFLNGDYENQESTEEKTESVIRKDRALCALLEKNGILIDEVSDYHQYPIADNPSPRLSADRLEYTLGNLLNYGFQDIETISRFYHSIVLTKNEDGIDEMAFKDEKTAEEFSLNTLSCSKTYTAEADRYSMQMLSEVIKKAIDLNVISMDDLYKQEKDVIARLQNHLSTRVLWDNYTKMNRIVKDGETLTYPFRIIPAKKRYIDPLVENKGRISALSALVKDAIDEYLNSSFDERLSARGEINE